MVGRLEGKVIQWINEQFAPGAVDIIDFPILPGGKIVRDKFSGEMMVFYDILTGEIETRFRE